MTDEIKKEDVKHGLGVKIGDVTKLGLKITETEDGVDLNKLYGVIQVLRVTGTLVSNSQNPELPYKLGEPYEVWEGCFMKLFQSSPNNKIELQYGDLNGSERGYICYNPQTDHFNVGFGCCNEDIKLYLATVQNSPNLLVQIYKFFTDKVARVEMASVVNDVPKVTSDPIYAKLPDILKEVYEGRVANCDPMTVSFGKETRKWRIVTQGVIFDLVAYMAGDGESRYEKVQVKDGKHLGYFWFAPNDAIIIETEFYRGDFWLRDFDNNQPDFDQIADHIKHFILN